MAYSEILDPFIDEVPGVILESIVTNRAQNDLLILLKSPGFKVFGNSPTEVVLILESVQSLNLDPVGSYVTEIVARVDGEDILQGALPEGHIVPENLMVPAFNSGPAIFIVNNVIVITGAVLDAGEKIK